MLHPVPFMCLLLSTAQYAVLHKTVKKKKFSKFKSTVDLLICVYRFRINGLLKFEISGY